MSILSGVWCEIHLHFLGRIVPKSRSARPPVGSLLPGPDWNRVGRDWIEVLSGKELVFFSLVVLLSPELVVARK